MDQLLEHQLSSLSSSPSSSSSLLISFQFLSFFYDEYDVTDTKKDQKASLETLFSSQLEKYLSLSNNTILSSSSPFSASSSTFSELHYSILLLLSTSVKLGGILHGISSLYSSAYSSLYQLVVVYFFLLPPPSIPSSSSVSSMDIAKKECFLLSHSVLRELLIQQEYPIKPANQQLQYQIISFLCSESERFLSSQQEEILHSNRKVFSSSVNVFLNELLQTMILIATNTLYSSSSSSSAVASDGNSAVVASFTSLLPSLVSLILRILSFSSSSSASSAAAKKRLLLSFDFWFELEGLSPEEREEDLSLSNSFFFQLFQLLFVHIQYPSGSRSLTREGREGEEGDESEEENEELLLELRDLELGINDLFPFCFSCGFSDCFSFLFQQFQQSQQPQQQQQQQSLSSIEGILFCFFCCSKVIKDHLLLSSSDGSMVTATATATAAVSKSKNDILRFLLVLSNACFQVVSSFSSVSASSSSSTLKHQFSRSFCLFLGSLTSIYCSSFNDDSGDTKRFPFPLENDLLQQLKDAYLTTLKYCFSVVFSSPSDSAAASMLISSSTSSLPLLAAKTIQRLLTHCSLLKKENERVTLSNILTLFFSLFNPSSSLSLSSLAGSPDKVMATSMILEGFAVLCYEIRENRTLSFLLVELSQPFLQALQLLLTSLSVTSSTSSKELHNRLKMLVLSCQQIIIAKMKISADDAELNEKANTFLRWLLREIWAILSPLFTFCLPSMDSSATSSGSFGLSLVFSTYSQFILTLSLLQIPKEIQITMIQNASSVTSSPFTDLLSLKSILLFLPDFVDSYYVNQVQLEEQEVLGDRLMMITGDISQKLVSASSSSSDLSQQVGRILEMEGGMEVFSAYFQLLLLHLQRNRSGFLAFGFSSSFSTSAITSFLSLAVAILQHSLEKTLFSSLSTTLQRFFPLPFESQLWSSFSSLILDLLSACFLQLSRPQSHTSIVTEIAEVITCIVCVLYSSVSEQQGNEMLSRCFTSNGSLMYHLTKEENAEKERKTAVDNDPSKVKSGNENNTVLFVLRLLRQMSFSHNRRLKVLFNDLYRICQLEATVDCLFAFSDELN
jgi:hypothetical protein